MRRKTKTGEYLEAFMMQSYALNELLGILRSICENLDLSYLNPKIRHFKYFRFTFFGLMVKAKSLLDMMIFKMEFVKNQDAEYGTLYKELLKIKNGMELAYSLIYRSRMNEGKIKIMQVADEYTKIFETLKSPKIKNLYKPPHFSQQNEFA